MAPDDGQMVCWTGQTVVVALAGQMVEMIGQVVAACGQSVLAEGHWV